MQIVPSDMRMLKNLGMVILFGSLLLSCKSGPDGFGAVIVPGKTTVMTRDRIKVAVDFSRDNLMKTKLTVANNSRETIFIVPEDVILRIEEAGVALRAIGDFKGYVAMRYEEAQKECARSKNYYCAGAIETFFRPFLEAKAFKFGIIPPGDDREGYIAFNLPDPFNRTTEARQVADSLKSMMTLLNARIEINTWALSKNRAFVFPVNVTTYSDVRQNPLFIMRFFNL